MVSNTVAVDAITFSIFISYWWKIFGNRHIRGESRVCHMHVHITRCIHLHHKLTKNWCITNTLLSANQRILSVTDIIAYSFKKCTVCKSVPKELFSSFLQMIEKRALVDYVIFHVNICHILNKFKHNFFLFLCWKIYAQRTMQAIFVYFLLLFISTATRGARVTSQDACWDMSISNEKIKFATHLNFDTFTLKMIRVRFRWHWMCLSS